MYSKWGRDGVATHSDEGRLGRSGGDTWVGVRIRTRPIGLAEIGGPWTWAAIEAYLQGRCNTHKLGLDDLKYNTINYN